MRPVVMLVNWDWFQTNRLIGRIDSGRIVVKSCRIRCFNASPVTFGDVSQPNRGVWRIGFGHGMKH
jgi:hypothetical protein